jgi:Tfp pilus assembly protein PilF
MVEWLKILLLTFYAPLRGMRTMRDRAALAPAGLTALISQVLYFLAIQWLERDRSIFIGGPASATRIIFQSAVSLLLLGGILVPVIAFVGNLFERRGSFSLLLQQEYASLASTIFYAFAVANLFGILAAVFLNLSGIQTAYITSYMQNTAEVRAWLMSSPSLTPDMKAQLQLVLNDPRLIAESLFRTIKLLFFTVAAVLAVREVLRVSTVRAVAVFFVSLLLTLLISPLWTLLFTPLLASPFLLLMLFFLIRGYVGGVLRTQRARESFRQNLEAATLNPADASAHYNLGLIHQQRGELDAARERFERAVQIDDEEIDAHYQLGLIARQQKRLADAIRDFEQVVSRDPSHAQHEVWREVGATYIAAGQYDDARTALERFLERRTSDPEALYLMGRAHAGLGHGREAASSMQACIEAVKTAPAYKYRAEKRWLNEAQQFLRSQV